MLGTRSDATPTPLGTRMGGFLLQERLGAGGMAEVFLAVRQGPERTELAAVKRLLPSLTFDVEFVRMFLTEVEITRQLVHPGIARLLDCGTGDGGHFLAMEYVHGHDVREVLGAVSKRGAPLGFVLGLVAELADALHYAHEFRSEDGKIVGFVHRDVSPSNVRISTDGQVKLLDFGIARAVGHTRVTKAGTLKGKVGYMSPEQCRAEGTDRRTDIFAMGVLLYELLTGRRAFFGETDLEALAHIIQGQYVPLTVQKPNLPVGVTTLVHRMLRTDPDGRPQTAAEVAAQLRALAEKLELDIGPEARALTITQLVGQLRVPEVHVSPPTLHVAVTTQRAPVEPEVAPVPLADDPSPRRRGHLVFLAALIAAVGVGGFFAGQRTSDPDVNGVVAPQRSANADGTPGPEPEPKPEPKPEPGPGPAPEPEPEVEFLVEREPEPEVEFLVEREPAPESEAVVGDHPQDVPARPRRRRRAKQARVPEAPAVHSGPKVDPDSILAPSLR